MQNPIRVEILAGLMHKFKFGIMFQLIALDMFRLIMYSF